MTAQTNSTATTETQDAIQAQFSLFEANQADRSIYIDGWLQRFVITFLAALVSLSFGLSYGVGNHNTYLLAGLRKLDPDFLQYDWLAAQTFHYHPVFATITQLLGRFGEISWNFAILNVILITISLVVLYRLLVYLAPQYALLSTLLLFFLVVLEGTESIATSYIFDYILQPSTLASAALLIAMASFLRGKFLLSGIFLGLSGAVHINYLIVGMICFGVAHLLLGWDGLIRHGFKQFTVSLIVVYLFSPVLIQMASAENGELSRLIFQFVRSPHHYIPTKFSVDFIPFVGWHLLALSRLKQFVRQVRGGKRMYALYVSFLSLVVLATLLTTIVFIPFVSQLFFWRLAPFTIILAQIVLIVTLVPSLLGRTDDMSPNRLKVTAVGLLCLSAIYIGKPNENTALFLTAVPLISLTVAAQHWPQSKSSVLQYFRSIQPIIIPMGLLIVALLVHIPDAYAHSSLLTGSDGSNKADMYEWAKTTEPDATFLIPPRLINFRLQSGRAVVVDWKSTPILPDELVEWYKRIIDISNNQKIRTLEEAEEQYAEIEIEYLLTVGEKYAAEYAIFREPLQNKFDLPVVYQNDKYIVYQLPVPVE